MNNIVRCWLLYLVLLNSLAAQNTQGILKGFVTDKKTDVKLQYVSIVAAGTDKGTTTDHNGYFKLELPPGKYTIEARIIGYDPVSKQCEILAGEKTSLFYFLESTPVKTGEVSVIGSRYDDIRSKGYELLPGDLKNIPQFGEADPFRALFALPGVNSINDVSNQLYVRGGNFDETMISLDEVPVYNTYHLGGIFSSINSDIISHEKIYLSNYPQSSGGYLSGILALSTKPGRSDAWRVSASLGIISSRGYIEGPLGKGTLVASARRTYLDALNLVASNKLPYYFYDAYAKYTLPYDDKNLLRVSAFYSKDVLQLGFNADREQISPYWGNLLLNLQLTHMFDSKNSLKFQLYLSNFFMDADNTNSNVSFDNLISDLTFKCEYEMTSDRHEMVAGAEYKNQKLDYSWDIRASGIRDYINPPEEAFFDYAPNPYSFNDQENTATAYLTDKIKLIDKLLLRLGFRGSYLKRMDQLFPSASAGIDYHYSNNISFSLNFGRYFQYLYTLKDNRPESIFAPFSVYFLSDSRSNTPASDHYSAGVNITGLPFGTGLDIEAYYKARRNLASSYNDYPRYRFEKGYALGLDILLKKDNGVATGWVGYSYGRSIKENNEFSYYSNYDKRHVVKILLCCQLSEKWKVSAFWTYAGGTPFTDIIGKYPGLYDQRKRFGEDFLSSYGTYGAYWRAIDGPKNQARTGDHHRLDIGLTGSFIWGKCLISPFLQILNAYNNPNYIVINPNLQEDGNDIKFKNSFIIPTIGVGIEF